MGRSPMENSQRTNSENCDSQFGNAEYGNPPLREARCNPSASKAAETKSKHEGTYDNCNRLSIHAVNGKQGPLPHDLVYQSRHTRTEEQTVDKYYFPLLSGIVDALYSAPQNNEIVKQ